MGADSISDKHSNPLRKLSRIILVITIIVILIPVVVTVMNTSFNYSILNHLPSHKTGQAYHSQNILFPQSGYDPSGRDIYYVYNNILYNGMPFEGVGVVDYPPSNEFKTASGKLRNGSNVVRYIVASFVKWESIPGSTDKYMVIQDNIGVMNMKTNKQALNINKVRIPFTNFNSGKGADLSVQDLSSIIPKFLTASMNTNGIPVTTDIGNIGSLSQSQIDTLIKPGDVMGFMIPTDSEFYSITDSNNVYMAYQVVLRRFNAQQEISKELGKSIPLK